MPLQYRITIVATFLLLLFVPAQAEEWQPSQPEYMYIRAVAAGDIQKARDLVELGNLDPANISGHPLVSYLANNNWGNGNPALWSDEIFKYVFEELKQDPNATIQSMDRTVFSAFCEHISDAPPDKRDALFHRTVDRIHAALRLGARVTPFPSIKKPWDREYQPLPACLTSYESLKKDSPLRTEFLQLIDLYLSKGADPNTRYGNKLAEMVPLTVAIRNFDIPLLAVLLNNHANPRLTYNVGMNNGCGLGRKRLTPTDTLLVDIPDPMDDDLPRAEPFLKAFAASGGDVRTPIFTCKHETKTLKEMAVDNGQIEYARMAMRLEKEPPTAADAPKLPDDFHYGGHTAHDSDDLAAAPVSPATPSRPASSAPTGSCPGPVISVQVEAGAGKSDPPAWIAPDTTSGSLGIDLRQQWHNLKGQHTALHCMLSPTMDHPSPRVVVVSVPDNITTCTFASGLMTCMEERPKKVATAKAVSPDTGFVTPNTTVTEPNALSPEADQQLREMVYTMFGGETSQPFALKAVYHTPNGEVGETTTTRMKPIFEGPCRLALDLAAHTEYPLTGKRFDINLSIKIDFTKATNYRVQFTPETLSTQGPPNTQVRDPNYVPKTLTNVTIFGDGAMCVIGKFHAQGCSTATMGKASRTFTSLDVDAQQRAFATLKKRCASAPSSAVALPQNR